MAMTSSTTSTPRRKMHMPIQLTNTGLYVNPAATVVGNGRDDRTMSPANAYGYAAIAEKRGPFWLMEAPMPSHFELTPAIHHDIQTLILQYLQENGLYASMMTLRDETGVIYHHQLARRARIKRLKKAIIEGDWNTAETIMHGEFTKKYRFLVLQVYQQQYFELIERQEYQKAFTFLTRKLKPLEPEASDFRELCYLLSCKSVCESDVYRSWGGVAQGRERLVQYVGNIFEYELNISTTPQGVQPSRLITLLQQAVAYQMQHHKRPDVINTLLEDYKAFVLPNLRHADYHGHRGDVKSICFAGSKPHLLVSSGSDCTIRVWSLDAEQQCVVLHGHSNRVWQTASDPFGTMLISASADQTVKLWSLTSCDNSFPDGPSVAENSILRQRHLLNNLSGHIADVFACDMHPRATHACSAGIEGSILLHDLSTSTVVRRLGGNDGAIYSCIFNRHGNLILTGGKDASIRFFDIVSGSCIQTFTGHNADISGLVQNDSGLLLLSSSKDNSIRLWDIRMSRPMQRYRGHLNTAKSFIKACFGPSANTVSIPATYQTLSSTQTQNSAIRSQDEASTRATSRSNSVADSSADAQITRSRRASFLNATGGTVEDTSPSLDNVQARMALSTLADKACIIGGSEDGQVYIWDMKSGDIVDHFISHKGVVYQTAWNDHASLLATCGQDGAVRIWTG